MLEGTAVLWEEFQSTLPVRGATCWATPTSATIPFQSTLPVRGATMASIAFWRACA